MGRRHTRGRWEFIRSRKCAKLPRRAGWPLTQRHTRTDRKTLLLGTALVSTLLLGAALAPSQAFAESKDFGDQIDFPNATKRTTGIEAILPASIIPSAPQNYLEPDQTLTLTNGIVIDNSGDIDPPIAILAVIDNDNIDLENLYLGAGSIRQTIAVESVIVIDNTGKLTADETGIVATIGNDNILLTNDGLSFADTPGNFGTLAVYASVDQVNTLDSVIIIDNDGAIAAGIDGMNVAISNFDTSLVNNGEADTQNIYNGTQLTQVAEAGQSNAHISIIEIDNDGTIDAGAGGIAAAITAQDAYLYNGCACGIDTFNFGDVNLLGQSVDIGQENVFVNGVVIENGGDIISGARGLYGLARNTAIELKNDALGNNYSDGDVPNLAQTAVIEQANLVANAIYVDNGATISSAAGIQAVSDNNFIAFGNIAAGMPGNAVLNLLPNQSLNQSADIGQTSTLASIVTIENRGAIDAQFGIFGLIDNSNIDFDNGVEHGNEVILAVSDNIVQSTDLVQSNTVANYLSIDNAGSIKATEAGIQATIGNGISFYNGAATGSAALGSIGRATQSLNVVQSNTVRSDIAIVNRGEIEAGGIGILAEISNGVEAFNIAIPFLDAVGAQATYSGTVEQTNTVASHIDIANEGRVEGGDIGIRASIDSSTDFDNMVCLACAPPGVLDITQRNLVESRITIVNTGLITADSLFAIDTEGAATTIVNSGGGVIVGFVRLSDEDDLFDNRAGGTFEARRESDFGGGNDLFRNRGTVHTASDPNRRETTKFVNLTRFENRGLISMVDGRVGDTFELANTAGQRNLDFVATGNSTLAVDAFLGGPGSVSDELIIDGNISGRTALQVNDTNPNPGAAGAVIPVVIANSDNVKSDTFFLPQPIDTGFFNYDLFFRPTGSGVFELRSFPGGGALLLPQLVTSTHDIWHQGSSTWFDRTADLRVLLAGGAMPIAYNPNGGYADGTVHGMAMTPAVWARGAGAWLDRDGSERATAFGRTYNYDLGRDLDVLDWQMGLDLGTRDLMSPGDILVFGLLGGFVGASLDYDQLARHFDFSGGQIGGYATYLNGGLFVDTLLNAHLLELETRTLGFANSLDANTLGLRTDTGYRFGSFSGGAFVEPLATIAVLWSDIDGFTNGGNAVAFDDEANVRGRLGLRVGTSYPVWGTTTVEPFVIGSVWGNLSGDNRATLTSTGTTFRFEDDLDDVWGEVSAGVNFFNPSANTAVFAKLDVTFGDDVDGIGGKAGMRVAW